MEAQKSPLQVFLRLFFVCVNSLAERVGHMTPSPPSTLQAEQVVVVAEAFLMQIQPL